jgi:hypothetical protein
MLITEPISCGLQAGLHLQAQTWCLTLCACVWRPSLRKLGLFWADCPPPLLSASIACSPIARTFVNLPLFPAVLCWRMSLRHCQIVEHLGRISQRHGTWGGSEAWVCFQGSRALTFMVRILNSAGPWKSSGLAFCLQDLRIYQLSKIDSFMWVCQPSWV